MVRTRRGEIFGRRVALRRLGLDRGLDERVLLLLVLDVGGNGQRQARAVARVRGST